MGWKATQTIYRLKWDIPCTQNLNNFYFREFVQIPVRYILNKRKCFINFSPYYFYLDTCRQLKFTIPNVYTWNLMIYQNKNSISPWQIVNWILCNLRTAAIVDCKTMSYNNFSEESESQKIWFQNCCILGINAYTYHKKVSYETFLVQSKMQKISMSNLLYFWNRCN